MIGLRLAFSIILLLGGLFSPVPAVAQEAAKVARIGWLGGSPARGSHLREAFLQGLRDLGYVDGRNLVIEYRYAEAQVERFPALAAELVALNVDVIVASAGTSGALAAKQATRAIPIVFVGVPDPVAGGLVTNVARPGGNVTGLSPPSPRSWSLRVWNYSSRLSRGSVDSLSSGRPPIWPTSRRRSC
jgi:putative ABC transport system substrate-binding protein